MNLCKLLWMLTTLCTFSVVTACSQLSADPNGNSHNALACNLPIEIEQKLSEIVDSSDFIAIADQHGNVETTLVLECLLTKLSGRVLMAYELPEAARCGLSLAPEQCPYPWTGGPQDGRASKAAHGLLVKIDQSNDIDLRFFDPDLADQTDLTPAQFIELREEKSSTKILSHWTAKEHDHLILFSGSLRASRDPYSMLPGGPVDTLLMRLESAIGTPFVSVISTHNQKSKVWQCQENCGPQDSWPNTNYFTQRAERGFFDEVIEFEKFTLSPPAVAAQ